MKTRRLQSLRFRFVLAVLIVCAGLLDSGAQIALGCPSCKAALASNGDLVKGFFWSILFMMAMPFTLLGTFSLYMYREVRRARAKSEPPSNPPREPVGAATANQETLAGVP